MQNVLDNILVISNAKKASSNPIIFALSAQDLESEFELADIFAL